MTDKEAFIAMLDKAGIPWEYQEISRQGLEEQLPEGSTAITINSNGGGDKVQPYTGGYSYFFTEVVFGPAGNLLAVWSWE